jgi:hypothetical protein
MTSDDEIDFPAEFWQILDLISGHKIEECPICLKHTYYAQQGWVFNDLDQAIILECHSCRHSEWVRTMTLDYPIWLVYKDRNNA